MPIREHAPVGAPCWIDLLTSDPDRSRAFYAEVFGWTSEESGEEFGGYINFSKDGHRIAGCMGKDPAMDAPDGWSVYLAVEDAERTAEAVTARGGAVEAPPMPVGDLGTMAFVTDPGGAFIGMWQPGEHRGFGLVGEHGTPSHVELHTRDFAASVTFYGDVFGWNSETISDAPEFRYELLEVAEGDSAGIMDATAWLPEGVPAHWSIYFAVDDVDQALAQIGGLGGSTIAPAEDTPYGRLATSADPTGAVFKLRGEI